jgi:hypothetical protein
MTTYTLVRVAALGHGLSRRWTAVHYRTSAFYALNSPINKPEHRGTNSSGWGTPSVVGWRANRLSEKTASVPPPVVILAVKAVNARTSLRLVMGSRSSPIARD